MFSNLQSALDKLPDIPDCYIYGKAPLEATIPIAARALILEAMTSKVKPSLPSGEICQDSFGNIPIFRDLGMHQRAIIALGKQDTSISGLSCGRDLEILGASSDHLVLDSKNSINHCF
jgi:predicted amino acid racemase